MSAYNPLEKLNLGKSVAEALLTSATRQLEDTEGLAGAGIYAIYYAGTFKPYAPITERNEKGQFAQPIYVGKAIPKGGRKGGWTQTSTVGNALKDRLGQHGRSISECKNLNLSDFHYRSLVVDDIWIPLGENMLIEMFSPVWNRVIDGFGNKDPGNRRKTQYKSPWDVLHPGRLFAEKLAQSEQTPAKLKARIADYFAGREIVLVDDADSTSEEARD